MLLHLDIFLEIFQMLVSCSNSFNCKFWVGEKKRGGGGAAGWDFYDPYMAVIKLHNSFSTFFVDL